MSTLRLYCTRLGVVATLAASACACDESERARSDAAPSQRDAGREPERDAGESTDGAVGVEADAGFDAGGRDSGVRFDECPPHTGSARLDDGCREEVCHVAIRFSYRTLAPRGWSVAGGRREPIERADAVALARDAVGVAGKDEFLLWSEAVATGPAAGVITVAVDPLDFGAVALVGAESGALIMAAGVVYSGAGAYWLPERWRPASEITCGGTATEPSETFLGADTCRGDSLSNEPAASAQDALDRASRSSVAQAFAARGAFAAHVHLYTPTVGLCNPANAEYVVVLSQQRPAS